MNDRRSSCYEDVALERRPIAPGDVRPPIERLDLKWWLALPTDAARPSDAPGDVTVVMQAERPVSGCWPNWPVRTTVRRHHPWTYTEDLYNDGRRKLSFMNRILRLGITFENNAAGEPTRLSITKSSSYPVGMGPERIGRSATILGEPCDWFDMMPGVADVGHAQCRTADGVVLKDVQSIRGPLRNSLLAVRLSRSAVGLDAVLPPAAILAPATWGILD